MTSYSKLLYDWKTHYCNSIVLDKVNWPYLSGNPNLTPDFIA